MRVIALLVTSMCLAFAAHDSFANPAHDTLASMTEAKRAAALTAYMSSSGESCGTVTKTFFQGLDQTDRAYWNVKCSDGSTYLIQVDSDSGGSTKILDCSMMAALNTPCFVKW